MQGNVEHDNHVEVVTLRMTRDELFLLANCINETIESIEDWEFSPGQGSKLDR
jgi:hypothetical protein